MAEIEITLPTVAFGNVKVRATPEELGLESVADSHALGVAAAVYLNLFSQGFKVGAAVDVSAPVSDPEGEVEDQAKELLDEGLGGVTEVPEHEVGDTVTVGGTEFTKHGDAPWNKGATVDAKPKPWETGSKAPEAPAKVATIDW